MGTLTTLKDEYRIAKAHLKGEGVSRARLIKNALDIDIVAKHLTVGVPPVPIKKAIVRMFDGKPMQFYTDGSLRHAAGRRLMKAERKALKKARRAAKSA